MTKLNDYSLFPFGPYKNVELVDVPDQYLLDLYKQEKVTGDLLDYIEDNMDAILNNIKVANERD